MNCQTSTLMSESPHTVDVCASSIMIKVLNINITISIVIKDLNNLSISEPLIEYLFPNYNNLKF
jgi:hypothetical protein